MLILSRLTCGNAKHNYYRCIKTLCRWLSHTDQLPTNPIEKVVEYCQKDVELTRELYRSGQTNGFICYPRYGQPVELLVEW